MHWQSVPVTVTRNPRARKVWLKMRSCRGIEVVLPYRVSAAAVPSILERHRIWLLERLADLQARGEAPGQNPLPERIDLPFLGRHFDVVYGRGQRGELRAEGARLRVTVPAEAAGTGALLLQKWLVHLGTTHLVSLCRELAARYNVAVTDVQVRNQSGRWGSCSPRAAISLNAKLLFLPQALAQHIFVHELCHVTHRNHGPAFRAALRALDPLTDQHEARIRTAWEELPAWVKWRHDHWAT